MLKQFTLMMQQLGKKLQLKQGQQILLLNAPASVVQLLSEEGYAVATEQKKEDKCDAVQLFVQDKAELNKFAQEAIDGLNPAGVLWIAYPKKSSGVVSDLTRDNGWSVISALGYAGVRQVAIDAKWSSLRFKHKSERSKPSKMGAAYPGIDKTNRVVTPPADLQEALDDAGLSDKFQALSFTAKKEYIVAVLEAKQTETRIRRIRKTIEQLTRE